MAPGPPIEMAMATPAMLPMPTVEQMLLMSAWKELISPSPELFLARKALSDHLNRRRGIAPEYMKRNNPPPISQKNRG
jgi:hypothetical protein